MKFRASTAPHAAAEERIEQLAQATLRLTTLVGETIARLEGLETALALIFNVESEPPQE